MPAAPMARPIDVKNAPISARQHADERERFLSLQLSNASENCRKLLAILSPR
jgi:hypothetical protein